MSGEFRQVLPQSEITSRIREFQRRIKLGERAGAMSDLARKAGLNRGTVYQAAAGHRISEISQIRLSRALLAVSNEQSATSCRFMHVQIGPAGPRLGFGLGPLGLRKG